MNKKNLQKPGEKPIKTGVYEEKGPRGGRVSDARQVTIKKDSNPLPPTQIPGRTWKKIRSIKKR